MGNKKYPKYNKKDKPSFKPKFKSKPVEDEKKDEKKYSKYDKKDKPSFKPKSKPVEEEFIRLNRYIAASGVCSRRQADEYIQKGLITVNGQVITNLGTKISKKDVVKFKGKILSGEAMVYIVMNKPKNYITSLSDPQGRPTVMDLFKGKIKERIYPVGRLDRATTGVLLFTNDGDLTKKLTHPKNKVGKRYVVTVNKPVTKTEFEKIIEGVELEDGIISADEMYYYDQTDKNKVIIVLHSGRNRIVRRIFEHLEYKIKNLDRIDFAGVTKKDLKRGQWRILSEKEIGFLKMKAGLAKQ